MYTAAPLVTVGTREANGSENLAPKHMAIPLGWSAYFGFVCTPEHSTYHNAERNGSFTVSYPRPENLLDASLAAGFPPCRISDRDGAGPSSATTRSIRYWRCAIRTIEYAVSQSILLMYTIASLYDTPIISPRVNQPLSRRAHRASAVLQFVSRRAYTSEMIAGEVGAKRRRGRRRRRAVTSGCR